MSFLPEDTRKQSFTTRKSLEFLKLSAGTHRIRILDEQAHMVYTHWINRVNIECLGDECPVCANNRELLFRSDGNLEEARKLPGWNSWNKRYFINILDRTPVKVHPDSENEFENKRDEKGMWPTVDKDTGKSLANIEPRESGKVKILSSGPTLFDDLKNFHETVGIETEVINGVERVIPLGITNYDVELRVWYKDPTKVTTRQTNPSPQLSFRDVVEVDEEELFDLERTVVTLEPEEIRQLQSGVQLRDIFASRNRDNPADANLKAKTEDLSETQEEVSERVKSLFDN
jgi:hypothetical protein